MHRNANLLRFREKKFKRTNLAILSPMDVLCLCAELLMEKGGVYVGSMPRGSDACSRMCRCLRQRRSDASWITDGRCHPAWDVGRFLRITGS
jgi:hypothetical protein